MLFFAVSALYFDLVVSGTRYRQVRRERDQLLRAVLSIARTGERSAHLAERSTSMAERALSALARREGEDGDDAGSD
jgi:hypothetical protein